MKTIASLLLTAWLVTIPVDASWAASGKSSSGSSSGGSAARFSGGFSSSRSTTSTAPAKSNSSFGSFSKKSAESDRPSSKKSALSQDLQRNQAEQRASESMMAREQAKRNAENAQRQQAQVSRNNGATPGSDFGRSGQSNSAYNNQYGNNNRANYPQQSQPVYQSQSDQQAARNRMIAAGAVGVAVGTMMGNANAHGQQATRSNERYDPINNSESGQSGGYGKGYEGGVITIDPNDAANAQRQTEAADRSAAQQKVAQTADQTAAAERSGEISSQQADKSAQTKKESGGFFKYVLIFALLIGLIVFFNRRTRKAKPETERYHLGKV